MQRIFLVGAALASWLAVAATGTTQQLPLVGNTDLRPLGSFTFPDVKDSQGNDGFAYANGVIAFNPANQSLFVVGHDWAQQVAEVRIPVLGGQALMLQPFRDALEGRLESINPGDPNSKKIGGLYVSGDRLIISAYAFYDAGGMAVGSHFVRSVKLTTPGIQGPLAVGPLGVAFTAGYFTSIPTMWQQALGGSILNGQCCLSIISRTSYGPSVSSLNPAAVLGLTNPVPAIPLVAYPAAHKTLGDDTTQGPLFNGTTKITGVVLPDGTRSVLFFGLHGMGPYCYGEVPNDCRDPENETKGGHAYPYEPHVWAYDVNDLAAVRAGARQPWDVRPYATWRLPGVVGSQIGGVTIDHETGRIFVSERYGDGAKLRVHVFAQLAGSPGAGTSASCSFTLTTGAQTVADDTSIRMAALSTQVVLAVAPSTGTCAWTASSFGEWLQVSPSSGHGAGQVVLTAPANTSSQARVAFALVANHVLTVSQDGVSEPTPRVTIPRPPARRPF